MQDSGLRQVRWWAGKAGLIRVALFTSLVVLLTLLFALPFSGATATSLSNLFAPTPPPDVDPDGDGIHVDIDTNPSAFSNDFSDGTTFGVILSRGGQDLLVEPANAVKITAALTGAPPAADISLCDGAALVSLDAGDIFETTCGSVSISVLAGDLEVQFVANNGTVASTTLAPGDSLTFEPTTLTLEVAGDSGPVVVVIDGVEVTIEPGETLVVAPRSLKLRAIDKLAPHESASKGINKAIAAIADSLEDGLWVDGFHLDTKHGHKVFDRERKAAKELIDFLKKGKLDAGVLEAAQVAVNGIVLADRILADTALKDAVGANVADPENQKKVDKEIAKAQEELVKGDAERDAGKLDKAIDHYKKAWRHSVKALKDAAKLPDDGDSGDSDDDSDDDSEEDG